MSRFLTTQLSAQNAAFNTAVTGKKSCRVVSCRVGLLVAARTDMHLSKYGVAQIFSPHICVHYHRSDLLFWTRDSSVSTVTRLRAGRSGVPMQVRARNSSVLRKVQTVSGADQPDVHPVFPPGVKAGRA